MDEPVQDAADADATPLSMTRLRAAFARMLGKPDDAVAAPAPDAVSPEGIVEAILFVGRADDTPISADEIAAVIRDVSPAEVEELIERLEARYREDDAACRVERTAGGYRLQLVDGLDGLADRLGGKVRSTKLTPTALECLSVIAYRQPIDGPAIDTLRGAASAATLRQLVRRGLVRCDPPAEPGENPRYATTDRFLRVMDLASLRQLPRVEELDD